MSKNFKGSFLPNGVLNYFERSFLALDTLPVQAFSLPF
jgi:hypothetical protein